MDDASTNAAALLAAKSTSQANKSARRVPPPPPPPPPLLLVEEVVEVEVDGDGDECGRSRRWRCDPTHAALQIRTLATFDRQRYNGCAMPS